VTLALVTTSRFRKDYKREAANPKRAIGDLQTIVAALADGSTLPASNRDHKLQGKLCDCRECHITSDWLLIYRLKVTSFNWSAPARIRSCSVPDRAGPGAQHHRSVADRQSRDARETGTPRNPPTS